MERLKLAVPADLQQAVDEGTDANLPSTTSLLFAFLEGLPHFHQVISKLTDPELALCHKDKGRAAELKGRGNACFSKREFQQALGFYSQKLDLLEGCLQDCDRAIAISPNYAKAWYRGEMVNASLDNYSSAIHDLEVALSMEVTSSGKGNIEQELKLILLKHQNVNKIGMSSNDCKDAELSHTAKPHKVVLECISTPNKGRGMASPNDISPASLIHVEDPLAARHAICYMVCSVNPILHASATLRSSATIKRPPK